MSTSSPARPAPSTSASDSFNSAIPVFRMSGLQSRKVDLRGSFYQALPQLTEGLARRLVLEERDLGEEVEERVRAHLFGGRVDLEAASRDLHLGLEAPGRACQAPL